MRFLIAALSLTALVACSPQDAAPEEFVAVDAIAGLEGESPSLALASLHAGFPEGSEGRQELSVTETGATDRGTQVDLVMRGLLDDSVEGEHYRAIVVQDPQTGLWRVESLSRRWICRRGGESGWTTQLCP